MTGNAMKENFSIPGSITCFFTPEIGKDFRDTGSYGVGIAVKNGVEFKFLSELDSENGLAFKVPTVVYALNKLKDELGVELQRNLDTKINFPIGCGFGMSSSLTFSAVIGACKLSGKHLDIRTIADIVHEAEVINKTGLGDAVCQMYGGVVCRLGAGLPSKIPVRKFFWDIEFDVLVLGKLETKEALKEFDFSSGKERLKEFLRQPTLDNLFEQSKKFAYETGIAASVGVDDVIEAVEIAGGKASMVMLGKTVFAINATSALREFGNPIKVKVDASGLFDLNL